jgi:beta-N-acetylhexosaminidase
MTDKKTRLKEMAGQRLMLGFEGTRLNEDLKDIISRIRAGGIILFRRNIESPEQVAELCKDCQDYARSCSLPPLFISVDQEGGVVARLKKPFTEFKGNPFIQSVHDAQDFAEITAEELTRAGINMNLAPVLDVAPPGTDSIMKDRVFTGDAARVSRLGTSVIRTFQEKGIMAVAKHFPGIGRTIKDSHFYLPVLDIDLQTLENSDLIPFVDAKNEGVAGIMLSHILYPSLDSRLQASLSPYIVNDLLRNRIGYEGLVMTDDLDMKAIDHDMETCIQQILTAGVDIALICHKGPNIDVAFHEVSRLLAQDETFYPQAKKSLERIFEAKRKYLGWNQTIIV